MTTQEPIDYSLLINTSSLFYHVREEVFKVTRGFIEIEPMNILADFLQLLSRDPYVARNRIVERAVTKYRMLGGESGLEAIARIVNSLTLELEGIIFTWLLPYHGDNLKLAMKKYMVIIDQILESDDVILRVCDSDSRDMILYSKYFTFHNPRYNYNTTYNQRVNNNMGFEYTEYMGECF